MKIAFLNPNYFVLLALLCSQIDVHGQTVEWLIEPTYPYGEMLHYQYPVLGDREVAYTFRNGEVEPFEGAYFKPLDVHDNEKYDYYLLSGDSLYLKEKGTLNLSEGIYWSDASYSERPDITVYDDHVLYLRNDSVFYNNFQEIKERYIGPSFYIGTINSRYITKTIHSENNKQVLLDFNGRTLFEEEEGEQYLNNYPHLVTVQKGDRFKLLNLAGEEVMPYRSFSSYGPRCVYNDSVLIVQEGTESVFFKRDKAFTPPTKFRKIDHFPIAVCDVSHSLFQVRSAYGYGIMDANFELIAPTKFKSIWADLGTVGFIYGYASGESTVFNRMGEEIITLPYDGIKFVGEDRYAVMKNRRWGVVDGRNQVIMDFNFYLDDSYPNIRSMEVNGHPLIFVTEENSKNRSIYRQDGSLLGQFDYSNPNKDTRLFYDFVWHTRALTPDIVEAAAAQGVDLNPYWITSVPVKENDYRSGIVDSAGNEVLPAEYEMVHRIPGTHVFLCRDSQERYGLLRIR